MTRPADETARDAALQAIIEHGRQTRTPTPRWLWVVAALVGGICLVGFALAMLGAGPASEPRSVEVSAIKSRGPAAPAGGGLGIGLAIGTCVGIVIGFSIARQRAAHSSRNRP